MPPRGLVSILAVFTLGLERMAYYGLRSGLLVAFQERGIDGPAAETLRNTMTSASTALTVLIAVVAIFVPRTMVAVVGLLTACVGAAVASFGPPSQFIAGVWLAMIGSGVFKAVSLAMCAEFASTVRLKIVLVVVAYAFINMGSFAGVAWAQSPLFHLALICYGAALIVAAGELAGSISLRSPAVPPAPTNLMSACLVALITLPTCSALWATIDALYSAPVIAGGSPWLVGVNSGAVVSTTMLLAGVLMFVAPPRLLPWLTLGSLLIGIVLVAFLVTAVVVGRPHSEGEGVLLFMLEAAAEATLVSVSLAACLALAPPRAAPLIVATLTAASSLTDGILAIVPPVARGLAGVVLVLLGFPLAVLLVALRKQLLGPLALQEV